MYGRFIKIKSGIKIKAEEQPKGFPATFCQVVFPEIPTQWFCALKSGCFQNTEFKKQLKLKLAPLVE